MEAFLAILARSRPCLPQGLADAAGLGLSSIAKPVAGLKGCRARAVSGENALIWACQREEATDVAFSTVDGKVVYVQGCIEPIRNPDAPGLVHLADDKRLPRNLLAKDTAAKHSMLRDLTGSFHLVIFDPMSGELFAVTDRLNTRPLFIYSDASIFAIASDIRAILALPNIDRDVDIESLVEFARTQTLHGSRTLYARISILMPATVLFVESQASRVKIETYWTMAPLEPFSSDSEAIEETASAFEKAIGRVTRGTQRAGVLLSGGLDSRLLLATAKHSSASMSTYTFGPSLTDEGEIARSIARKAGLEWHSVIQSADDYWCHLGDLVPVLQGFYSVAHTHPFRTSRLMAQQGIDTIYHGLELCVTFSGSYLPKNYYDILKRRIYDYRLLPLPSTPDVKSTLIQAFDLHQGTFSRSYLCNTLQDVWQHVALSAFVEAVDCVKDHWADPYDQYEKAILHAGFTKFRSYSVATCNRPVARERSLMPDAGVIDAYLRLSVRQRFLGPVYRRSLRLLLPELANITYANIGTSPFASPTQQAIVLQGRRLWRQYRQPLGRVLSRIGLRNVLPARHYGSYPSSVDLVRALAHGQNDGAARTRAALESGILVEAGIIEGKRIRQRLAADAPMEEEEGFALLALASLAAWFEQFPGTFQG